MQQPRRAASATTPQPSAPSSSSRFSSIPRPTVTTSFDNHQHPAFAQQDNPLSPQASTPDALSFYGQGRPSNPTHTTKSPTPPQVGSFERPSLRSVSASTLTTSRSSPTIANRERLQKTSIKDLVAKFNQNNQNPTSQPNAYPRKPTPTSTGFIRDPAYVQRDRPRQKVSADSIHRKPHRASLQQPTYRETPRHLDSLRSQTDGSLVGPTRPRTADIVNASPKQPRQPLFGEVIPDGGDEEQADFGYGISQKRPRRVSEGSMHYPNPMFPEGRSSYIEESPIADESSNGRGSPNGQAAYSSAHARSRSDLPGGQQFSPQSRLPVRTARTEANPNPAASATDDSTLLQPSTPPPSSSRRNDTSPGKLSANGQRLNAIISAPTPKESPPLRSSRPRQDVTTARSVSPNAESDRAPHPMGASPERTKLFAGVDMDLAARRNSIRKALRADREKNMQTSPTSPQRFFNRPTNSSILAPNHSPISPRNTTRKPIPEPTLLPQLSKAVYNPPPQGLKLKVQGIPTKPADEPVSGATQFEEDDSPIMGTPADFPSESGAPNDQLNRNVEAGAPESSNQTHQQSRPSRTVLSQIMEMRKDDPSQFGLISRPSVSGSSTLDADDAGTIQIMLSDTPAVNRLSAGWQSRDLHGESPLINDGSLSSTPSVRTYGSQNGRESSSTTLDKDPYNLINRILDQYRESGVVSDDMVQDFQHHIIEADPEFVGRDDTETMTIAKAALEDIIKDHSQVVEPSPQSNSDAFSSTRNGDDRPHWESVDSDSTITGIRTIDQQTSAGASELSAYGASGPIPPPKDANYSSLPPLTADNSLSGLAGSLGDGFTYETKSPADARPLLPEMPSTDGNLGLMPGGASANKFATQNQFTTSPDLPAGSFKSNADSAASLSSQATLIQQTSTISSSQHGTSNNLSQWAESHSRGPSIDKDSQKSSTISSEASEQRRLKQRRNLIKELVDTEYSFNQDMKVIEDIYKGTASSVTALTPEDGRVLFGNSAQVVEFSEAFLDALKQASRSVYKMPRGGQWRVNAGGISESNSGSQTEESSLASSEATDDERDRKTFIGDAFINFMIRMEKVYSEYLKNHDFANQRLQKLQTIAQVQLWLSECHAYANDITSAWDLDSLLVKPVQRILKYPLLLRSLLEQTPNDHPDHDSLVIAVKQSEDVSYRINESKKRAELLEQVVNKNAKRKDFDFSKVFSRRTDKIAHRVGLSEAVEDPDYKRLAEKYNGRYIELQVVMRDFDHYKQQTERFMNKFNHYVGAIEDFMDVGHSNSPEIESKWRKFAVTIREMTAIAYADHDLAVRKSCVEPMLTALKLHDGPKRLMEKRKKRIVEYAKFLTVKNRGDKVDKKLQEQGDQFVALNETLKDELPKLFTLIAKLVETCLRRFVELQTQWHTTWQKKIKHVLEEQQIPQNVAEIVESFNSDFSYTEAHVLSLGICNGSLLAETSNFLSSSSSFTMTDDSSSNKRPSLSAHKTSPSIPQPEFKRTSSGSMGLPFSSPRSSSESQMQAAQANGYSQYQPRYRADSNQSTHSTNAWNNSSVAGQRPSGPPAYNPAAYMPAQPPNPRFSRPADHPAQPQMSTVPSNISNNGSGRPTSSSTFYSATSSAAAAGAAPGQQQQQQDQTFNPAEPRYSGLFSSAMPMSESAEDTRPRSPGTVAGQAEPTVLFTAASMFEFNLDRCRREAGYPYLNYMAGEIFNVIGEKGELWLARNQDDPSNATGWIWEKHFAKLVSDDD